jgi:hypothetical protein
MVTVSYRNVDADLVEYGDIHTVEMPRNEYLEWVDRNNNKIRLIVGEIKKSDFCDVT